MKYLIQHWEKVKRSLSNKHIVLFLDYDGTLAPIAKRPEEATIPEATRAILRELHKIGECKITLITGRALKDIKKRVGIKNIFYVGNHGLEVEGPQVEFESPVSPRSKAIIKQIRDELTKRLCTIKGVLVEDKNLTLSVHYRLVNREDVRLVKDIFNETIEPYLVRRKIKIRSGKKVLEVRPPVEWHKGKVVSWLLGQNQFTTRERNVFPIYIGDDESDEDAFRVLRNRGLTIFVGKPRNSYARYYMKNPGEVMKFLRQILELKTMKRI